MYEAMYRQLYLIRRVEEEIARVYPTDKIKSPVHLSIGQEAAAVGVCQALRPDDVVFGTYRSHASYLAKGGDLNQMIAELYGKATGCAKGKGGSMHLTDVAHGVMGTSAVVGTTIPQAVGYAYALKLKEQDSIVVSFFGDGAVEEGVFHESLNFAALKKLPILFVCENNRYAIHSHQRDRQANEDIVARAHSYGLSAAGVEDGDVLKLYELTQQAVTALRRGGSMPWLLECRVYRWKEHVGPNEDFQAGYRSQDEAEPWMVSDQVTRLAGMVEPEQRQHLEGEVETAIEQAFAFAERSPFPDPQELYTDNLATG